MSEIEITGLILGLIILIIGVIDVYFDYRAFNKRLENHKRGDTLEFL